MQNINPQVSRSLKNGILGKERENGGKKVKNNKRIHTLIPLFNKLEPTMSQALFQTQNNNIKKKREEQKYLHISSVNVNLHPTWKNLH